MQELLAPAQVPCEDAWQYVTSNFEKLSFYYSHRYSKVVKDPDAVHDFSVDIMMDMVAAYNRYRAEGKSIEEINKIIKTVPVYFYQNNIKTKKVQAGKVELTDDIHFEKFTALFDKYYESFMAKYYRQKDMLSDEYRVLIEIFLPSDEYNSFILLRRKKPVASLCSLSQYFVRTQGWTKKRFREAFANAQFILLNQEERMGIREETARLAERLLEPGKKKRTAAEVVQAVITDDYALFSSLAIVMGDMKKYIRGKYGDVDLKTQHFMYGDTVVYRMPWKEFFIISERTWAYENELPDDVRRIIEYLEEENNEVRILIQRKEMML